MVAGQFGSALGVRGAFTDSLLRQQACSRWLHRFAALRALPREKQGKSDRRPHAGDEYAAEGKSDLGSKAYSWLVELLPRPDRLKIPAT